MLSIGALVLLLGCVFGSYLSSGGAIAPLAEALPFEMWTIGGAAVCSFIMSNSMHDVKHALGNFGKIIKGAAFHKSDYVDLLSLLYFLVRLASMKAKIQMATEMIPLSILDRYNVFTIDKWSSFPVAMPMAGII